MRPPPAPARAGDALLLSTLTAMLWFLSFGVAHAAPLYAGGNHEGQMHAADDHADEMLPSITLSYANLASASLKKSSLRYGILIATNLVQANLNHADFTGAILDGADLRRARGRQTVFADAGLRDADLSRANLNKADFRDADLRGAIFWKVKAKAAVFTGADLAGSDFRESNVDKADFRYTNLRGADLSVLKKADKANFSGATYDATTLLDPKIDTTNMIFASADELADPAKVPSLSGLGMASLVGLLLAGGTRRSARGHRRTA